MSEFKGDAGQGNTELEALRDAERMTLQMNQLCKDAAAKLEASNE